MFIFKCKMCGGTIEFNQGDTVGVCDSCGTKQTLPRLDDDRKANLYDRANHFRRNNEFDKAATIYEQILNEDTADAEAYWSLVLCNYGIEYVEDPSTHKRIPTVNRAQFTSIFDDDNYKLAIKYADVKQRELYENEAKIINDIQKGILDISQKEEPFDVFICYKETDNNGRRTNDSVLANELYHQLIQEGFKVFFARITLEDKLGTAYEPYIFAALNSAKVMVVLGTKPEYFNAVWVKNEWSRYLSIVKKSGGRKVLIPAFKDMDPYDLPDEFSHLQAQDMSKLGFMQDLIRGIKKIIQADVGRTSVKEPVITSGGNKDVAPLLERAFIFLEDSKWQDADIYCEKVLDIDPKNAYAYLGKLMADLKVNNQKGLADVAKPFDKEENYGKIIRFADEKLVAELRGYIEHINNRNENERLNTIYNDAVSRMKIAKTDSEYKSAAYIFKSISDFKDSDALAIKCIEQAKDSICNEAKMLIERDSLNTQDYAFVIQKLKMISDWKDSDEIINICQKRIGELIKKQEEAVKRSKKIKKMLSIIIIVFFAIVIVLYNIIMPPIEYNKAMNLIDSGDYVAAIEILKYLNYKDSNDKLVEIKSQYHKTFLTQLAVGATVYLGRNEKKEDIEWIVLDKKGNKALLLSKYILTSKAYSDTRESITWENSTIRRWLNSLYINNIFSEEEQDMILVSDVINNNNTINGTYSGNNTKDKLFLLSIDEVKKYFSTYSERKATYKGGSSDDWWLRTPGWDKISVMIVNDDGLPYSDGFVFLTEQGVRPALWVGY